MKFYLVSLLIAATFLAQVCTSFVSVPTTAVPVSSIPNTLSHWDDRHDHATTASAVGSKTKTGLLMTKVNRNNEDADRATTSTQRNRRHFFRDVFLLSASTTTSAAILQLSNNGDRTMVANAAMKSSQTTFVVGKDLTLDEAKERFKEGLASLEYLLGHYDEICANGGGDNVRRYLGSVGTTSGLYGIAKVMKTMQEEAADIVEYTETMNEVNAALVGADGSAYMAIFSKSHPEQYFGDAKIEVKRAMASMQEIAKQMDIIR
jgi:hypothetical protein